MHTFRTSSFVTLMTCAAGCQSDEGVLPPVQVRGRFLSYAADDDLVVCGGNVPLAEAWMEAVALRLGMNPDQIVPTTYYFIGLSLLEEMCAFSASGCADLADQHIDIFSTLPVHDHELVHAVHLSAWPRRQPLLHEGLASAFEQNNPYLHYSFTADAIDNAIEAESSAADKSVYSVGHYLVYWMLTRYDAEAFEQFWYATSRPTTAADFRAAFQDSFGESLDDMLVDVQELPICPIAVCVGEPLAWQQDTWRTESPTSCADPNVIGVTDDGHGKLVRNDLVEITEAGSYDISVSASDNPGQGATLMSCQNGCDQWLIRAGESYSLDLSPGTYRVTTVSSDPDEPGISVEIYPS